MKPTLRIVWTSAAIAVAAILSFALVNLLPSESLAHQPSGKTRTEEYIMITYSTLDKDNVTVWYGHTKKELIAIKKDQPVLDPLINVMHSLNSEGWQLVNNESFPYLNVVGTAPANLNSDAYHTLLFVMKRTLNPADE